MGKKFGIVLRKLKCVRCGKLVQIAKTQSRQKDGLITAYCYNPNHSKIKLRIMLGHGLTRTIRSNRMKSSIENPEFNLRKLKCPICGRKLFFDKKGSYQASGKILGYCYSQTHRLKIQIFSKLFDEPDFAELQEVILRESDR